MQGLLFIGFLCKAPSSYVLYNLDRNNPADYLPDTAFYYTKRINGAFAARLLTDKPLFSSMLGAHLLIPEILAVLERGQVFATHPGSTVRDVPGWVARSGSPGGVILKPNTGRRGSGVQRLQVSRRGISLDGQLLSKSAFKSKLADLDLTWL